MNAIVGKRLVVLLCFLLTLIFATYKLTESPTIWMDEGIITQVARNMARHNIHALQVAKDEYVSAGFVTTSYTATMPIALSFSLFGVGLGQARVVMVLFILLFFISVYLLKKNSTLSVLALTLLLFATFSPLYGHGKNVLGEIPGLFYLVIGLYLFKKIEMGEKRVWMFALAGFAFGLCIATKPIFILLAPALVIALWLLRKQLTWKLFGYFAIGFIVPLAFWLYIQFSHDSFSNILSIYINPHSNDFSVTIRENFLRFFTESTPIYCTLTMLVWLASFAVRIRRKVLIARYEIIAVFFSILIIGAYLRTPGYYRYFFEAQILSLIFLPSSLFILFEKKVLRNISIGVVAILVVFQVYQTMFNSWVAVFYESHRTEVLKNAISGIGMRSVFVYKAPEAVLFLPHDNFSQYMEVTKTIHVGSDKLPELASAKKDFVVTQGEFFDGKDPYLTAYTLACRADRYVILKRKNDAIMPITCAI